MHPTLYCRKISQIKFPVLYFTDRVLVQVKLKHHNISSCTIQSNTYNRLKFEKVQNMIMPFSDEINNRNSFLVIFLLCVSVMWCYCENGILHLVYTQVNLFSTKKKHPVNDCEKASQIVGKKP